MGQPVTANGRSVLHKGHGMTHTCAVPDVCKTPSPGGPIPIPYVNVAMDTNITDAAESVKIEGNPVANVAAKISTSTGDEPGSAGGGIMSGKIKGTVTWKMGSLDVKAEGKSVVRLLDTDFHNGNSFNTSFVAPGMTGMAYADDFEGPCPICTKDSSEHKILESESTADTCAKIVADLKAAYKSNKGKKKALYAKKGRRGYMVGVMICKCEKKFAAMSGTYALSGFKTIAQNHGCTVVNSGAPGDTARQLRPADIAGANQSGVPAWKIEGVVNRAWSNAEQQFKGGDKDYSPTGICAGAHLLTRAGHAPLQMTEMFFAPTGGWPKTYSFIVKVAGMTDRSRQAAQRFGPDVAKTDETPWGQTVGSCKTCQDLLAFTMCPERKC
jgi:hypothetical protein